MLVSLKSLIRQAGREQPLILNLPQAELGEVFPGVFASGDLHFAGTLRHLEQGVLALEGRVSLDTETPCARCLVPCRLELSDELKLRLIPERERVRREEQSTAADELADEFFYEGLDFDPQTPLLLALIQQIPLRQFCRPDCKGLCPQCGCDWNEGSCACQGPDEDDNSPFAKLKKLL